MTVGMNSTDGPSEHRPWASGGATWTTAASSRVAEITQGSEFDPAFGERGTVTALQEEHRHARALGGSRQTGSIDPRNETRHEMGIGDPGRRIGKGGGQLRGFAAAAAQKDGLAVLERGRQVGNGQLDHAARPLEICQWLNA
jgi:hypothetical protein